MLLLLTVSCQKVQEDCTRKGEQATIVRSVETFYGVDAGDRVDVILVKDPAKHGTIELSGPGNLFSGLRTEVHQDILKISDHNRCKWLRSLKERVRCTVYIDSLHLLYSRDDAAFHSQDTLYADHIIMDHRSTHDQSLLLNVRAFWLQHREAGTLNVSGKCDVLEVINYETGVYNGRNFQSNDAFVYQYGINAIHLSPKKRLTCQVENSGDILYHLAPVDTLIVSGRGSGSVRFAQ
ncbi:MAG: DUF2807 domain-containing protein [Bacteroidota bacterium]|nr:DUF2807 domain-containing protein [Bacteroidota bacterium]MDX5470242.1 DUF2807 domain-containing protein [Bacteroidota bacterium]